MDLYPMQLIFERGPIFLLVLFRVSGLVAACPLMGHLSIPIRVKVMLAMVLSVVIFPIVKPVAFEPNSFLGLAVGLGGEILIGATMGFVLSLLFVGIQVGSEMVSQQMGLSMSELVDPASGISTTVISQFYVLLATVIYVLMNGHLILIRSLAETFKTAPVLMGFDSMAILKILTDVLTAAFQLGVRMAGPAVVAIFLATLALGFISRTMPQLNILAAGFPLRIALGFALLVISFSMALMLFHDSLIVAFRQIGQIFI